MENLAQLTRENPLAMICEVTRDKNGSFNMNGHPVLIKFLGFERQITLPSNQTIDRFISESPDIPSETSCYLLLKEPKPIYRKDGDRFVETARTYNFQLATEFFD